MSRFKIAAAISALCGFAMLAVVGTSIAAKNGGTTLRSSGDAAITIVGNSATIQADPGEIGFVFPNTNKQGGKLLDNVVFAFQSEGDTFGGSPRFSIPIQNGSFNFNDGPYAFIDAQGCGGSSGVKVLVSTQNPNCHVNFQGNDYANWNTLADDFPTFTVKKGALPFITNDPAGIARTYVMTSISFGP